ncbi:hypothetical protein [Actinomycetospora soli]|uniref:hypothetical protein n=1 Tax=Actinomycetospora soli TaxID=2893887 RepID=UPI001E2C2604|nr:hypothetical protein [Actinomycetospora soli]MCD2190970.1 hypothetical protein [Actinomycetospora soli]
MTLDDHGLDELGGFDRARFDESIELARTQLAFPLPDPEPHAELDPRIDDEERER